MTKKIKNMTCEEKNEIGKKFWLWFENYLQKKWFASIENDGVSLSSESGDK